MPAGRLTTRFLCIVISCVVLYEVVTASLVGNLHKRPISLKIREKRILGFLKCFLRSRPLDLELVHCFKNIPSKTLVHGPCRY